jgi:hypothetical protein
MQNAYQLNKPSYHEGKAIYLMEAGLYELIFSSKLPIAIKFKEYVFEEVLPSIRKIGQEKYLEKIKETELLLKQKNDEINWLYETSKRQISFQKHKEPTLGAYIGCTQTDDKANMIKCGKSINPLDRGKTLSAGNSPLNGFKIKYKYQISDNLHNITEKYIHSIFSPLWIKNPPDGSSTEYFMIHKEIANDIIKKIIADQSKYTKKINEYIDVLENNKRDYSKINIMQFVSDIEDSLDNDPQEIIDEIIETKKICNQCQSNLSLSHFERTNKLSNSLRNICRKCHDKNTIKQRKAIRENPLIGMKNCDECNETFDLKLFFKNPDEPEKYMDYYKSCHYKLNSNIITKQ